MRITLHLDAPDRVAPCPYAVLWLDGNSHKWLREGHVGLDLPEWGSLTVGGFVNPTLHGGARSSKSLNNERQPVHGRR